LATEARRHGGTENCKGVTAINAETAETAETAEVAEVAEKFFCHESV